MFSWLDGFVEKLKVSGEPWITLFVIFGFVLIVCMLAFGLKLHEWVKDYGQKHRVKEKV